MKWVNCRKLSLEEVIAVISGLEVMLCGKEGTSCGGVAADKVISSLGGAPSLRNLGWYAKERSFILKVVER